MGNECITQAHDRNAALANYNKALQLYPEYIDALVRKGVTLTELNDYIEAEYCFNKALQIAPASFKAYYNRGKLRLLSNKIEGAVTDLDKATSLKPTHATAHELFGNALEKAGSEDLAELQWRIAKELRKKKR